MNKSQSNSCQYIFIIIPLCQTYMTALQLFIFRADNVSNSMQYTQNTASTVLETH